MENIGYVPFVAEYLQLLLKRDAKYSQKLLQSEKKKKTNQPSYQPLNTYFG